MMVQRSDLITKIEDRLAGRLGAAALAAWAFELFYAIDQGQREVVAEDADVVADLLDELLFADDESFALDETDLQRLLARLHQP